MKVSSPNNYDYQLFRTKNSVSLGIRSSQDILRDDENQSQVQ